MTFYTQYVHSLMPDASCSAYQNLAYLFSFLCPQKTCDLFFGRQESLLLSLMAQLLYLLLMLPFLAVILE